MLNQEIWIYAEHHENVISPVTFQLITKAKEIAQDKEVVVLLLESTEQNLEEKIKDYGPDKIIVVKNDLLNKAADSFIADLLAQLARRFNPNSIFFGATVVGRSISGRLQAKLDTGLTSDCLDLSFDDDLLIQTKPSYGDNIMCEIICPDTLPQMASVRPNIFLAKKASNKDLEVIEVKDLEFKEAKRIKVEKERPLLSKGSSIANASRVIAVGRGSASDESISLIKELANKLGAKIGVTRPLTDLKNFTMDDQIGQSGNTIAPRFLLNLGVHGAVQFTAGISNAETVFSVNNHPKAPIFDYSDYIYVGDAQEFVKEMLKIMQ